MLVKVMYQDQESTDELFVKVFSLEEDADNLRLTFIDQNLGPRAIPQDIIKSWTAASV